jgi:hypothetical protein
LEADLGSERCSSRDEIGRMHRHINTDMSSLRSKGEKIRQIVKWCPCPTCRPLGFDTNGLKNTKTSTLKLFSSTFSGQALLADM